MKLLLVTQEDIIKKVFTLVCKKLELDLIIQEDTQITDRYDIIVLDHYFIDDRFNIIKQYSKKLGAITGEPLPFEKAKDFVINRPFLPTQLITILSEQLEKIRFERKRETTKQFINDYETQNTVSYLDSLVEDIASDIEIETDESIIQKPTIKQGGVLDSAELSKIKTLLDIKKEPTTIDDLDEGDWLDLSEIIDKALEEVKVYEFPENKPIKLILSQYNLDELKPLLKKLNQSVIDSLTEGKEITLMLKLKEEN
ncbi:MAG: hypothetical protein RBR23_02380 [Arcobacteraceae bacterium]|jgi:hypothetical protein|nr:hypothetical protein [Arcobacteraceae bacterium]